MTQAPFHRRPDPGPKILILRRLGYIDRDESDPALADLSQTLSRTRQSLRERRNRGVYHAELAESTRRTGRGRPARRDCWRYGFDLWLAEPNAFLIQNAGKLVPEVRLTEQPGHRFGFHQFAWLL